MTFDRDAFHREAIQIPSHDGVGEMRDLLVETIEAEGHDPEIDSCPACGAPDFCCYEIPE